jgi:hypothetical protein
MTEETPNFLNPPPGVRFWRDNGTANASAPLGRGRLIAVGLFMIFMGGVLFTRPNGLDLISGAAIVVALMVFFFAYSYRHVTVSPSEITASWRTPLGDFDTKKYPLMS